MAEIKPPLESVFKLLPSIVGLSIVIKGVTPFLEMPTEYDWRKVKSIQEIV